MWLRHARASETQIACVFLYRNFGSHQEQHLFAASFQMGWPFWVTDPFLSIFFGSAEFSEVKSNHLKNYCIAFLQPSIYNGKQECKDYCLFQKFSWYDFAIIIGVAVLLTSTNSLLILIIGINLSVFLTSWASNKILFLSLNWTYCKTGEFFLYFIY